MEVKLGGKWLKESSAPELNNLVLEYKCVYNNCDYIYVYRLSATHLTRRDGTQPSASAASFQGSVGVSEPGPPTNQNGYFCCCFFKCLWILLCLQIYNGF